MSKKILKNNFIVQHPSFIVHSSSFIIQRGISLVLVVVIMAVILAIGLGISTIVLQQNRMLTEIGNSVIAFYAADNGIEAEMILDTPISTEGEIELPNQAKYQVIVNTPGTGNCPASVKNYCIKSIGSYGKTKRAIEIQY